MPRAVDAALLARARGLPLDRNPLQRISYQTPKTAAALVDPPNPIADGIRGFFQNLVGNFDDWLNSLLSRHHPIPRVTSGVIADDHPNLLLAPDFRADGTISLVPDRQNWTWTNTAGFDSIGCAHVEAAGYLSELLSNEIPVQGGQTVLKLSVRVKGAGVTFTGTNPIAVGVTRYMDRTEVGSEDLAFIASPATDFDWVELFDDLYEVPSDCDEIRLRLKVDSNLLAGGIDWDDASVVTVGMGLIDNIVLGLENADTPGYNYIDLLLSLINASRSSTDHARRITYLENLLSTGNKINDEFLRVGTTLGANWDVTITGAGGWKTDGDYAYWDRSGFSTAEAIARYSGTPSTTVGTTQRIIGVLGSKGQSGLGVRSAVDLYGRLNTAKTEWMRARFWSDGVVVLTRKLAGVETDLATVSGYDLIFNPTGNKAPGNSATIALDCGTASGARFFRVEINGTQVLGSDAVPVSDSTSALHQGYGMGVRAEGSLLALGQALPAKFNAWAAKDNT